MEKFASYVQNCAQYMHVIIPLSTTNLETQGSTPERQWESFQIWSAPHNPVNNNWMTEVSNARRFLGRPVQSLNKPGSEGFNTWLHDDLSEMSSEIRRLIIPTLRDQILSLSDVQLLSLMNVLQTLMDCRYDHHGDLQKVLHRIVRRRNLLPSYLFLSDIRPSGTNPSKGGRFADVWQGEHGEQCLALKVLRQHGRNDNTPEKLLKEFCKEAMVWRQFKHENLLPFYGVCQLFSPKFAMVSPWMQKGDLTTFLKHDEDADRLKIILAVAEGLRYLHTFSPEVVYVHGDLRAGNIFMDDDNTPRIADFGFTRLIDPQSTLPSSREGNGRWLGPELLDPDQVEGTTDRPTPMSDVYAFGCVCLEIFTGKVPFPDLNDAAVITAVLVKNKCPERPPQPAKQRGLNDIVWNMMYSCWRRQPTHRPDITTVVGIIKG